MFFGKRVILEVTFSPSNKKARLHALLSNFRPAGTRTQDQEIKSLLLYQLSYEPIKFYSIFNLDVAQLLERALRIYIFRFRSTRSYEPIKFYLIFNFISHLHYKTILNENQFYLLFYSFFLTIF